MSEKCFFFAGGGTGGHIYPAIAIAEKIAVLQPDAKIHFFVSEREIDAQILSASGFLYTQLPAKGFSIRPGRLVEFCSSFFESYRIANKEIYQGKNAVVVGVGGYVAAPVCWSGHKLNIPVVLLNVDILPGRANKVISHFADEIFVQFDETAQYFGKGKAKVTVMGCPLRSGFDNPNPAEAMEQLGLERGKKVLLITGASSGSQNINEVVCSLLERLGGFSEQWQIVHLTGTANYESVSGKYESAKIAHKVISYYDDMANLLACADLVIGRSGAVSVAEYAAAGVPSICMPYPYHKDRHQYLNAEQLVEAGAAVVVDDLAEPGERAEWLWEEMEVLLRDDERRREMKENCSAAAKRDAAGKIAERLLKMAVS